MRIKTYLENALYPSPMQSEHVRTSLSLQKHQLVVKVSQVQSQLFIHDFQEKLVVTFPSVQNMKLRWKNL